MELKGETSAGYLFSTDGGHTPIYYRAITDNLYRALKSIGINEKDRQERNITFHSWRHFFNSLLRSKGVTDSKLQRLTGHKTLEMTDHYTHFDLSDYGDVLEIQEGTFSQSQTKR